MPDIEKAVAAAVAALEALAKLGRPGWEQLAEKLADSEENDEINLWLAQIVEGEI